MKKVFCLLVAALTLFSVSAQIIEPIKWNAVTQMDSETEGHVTLSATVDNDFHFYALTLPDGGPNPTVIKFDCTPGIKLVGDLVPSRNPVEEVDMIFHLNLGYWDKDVDFVQKFTVVEPGDNKINVSVSFQACNGESCIAPATENFSLSVNSPNSVVQEEAPSIQQNTVPATNRIQETTNDLWAPVEVVNEEMPVSSSPWWLIFIWGFGGGLLALLTPCVWPLIPMTVSFFLKKGTPKSKSIKDAAIYGISIVVIYLGLGLIITMIFGASKLNELSTNALFNIIFFLLLVVFAISFFGAFDIKLPSKWSNGLDNKAERTTGLVSIFFMAFTLALVSFSCTGPIIGTLLVEAATMGNIT